MGTSAVIDKRMHLVFLLGARGKEEEGCSEKLLIFTCQSIVSVPVGDGTMLASSGPSFISPRKIFRKHFQIITAVLIVAFHIVLT